MKILIKPLAWTVVLTGWIFYGLLMWVSITHPRPEKDPVTDFQDGLKDMHQHWKLTLFMLIAVITYIIAWAYIKETKKQKGKDK